MFSPIYSGLLSPLAQPYTSVPKKLLIIPGEIAKLQNELVSQSPQIDNASVTFNACPWTYSNIAPFASPKRWSLN